MQIAQPPLLTAARISLNTCLPSIARANRQEVCVSLLENPVALVLTIGLLRARPAVREA